MWSSMEETFYGQPIGSNIKQSEEIRKLSRQKELDADPEAIQQIEFVGH